MLIQRAIRIRRSLGNDCGLVAITGLADLEGLAGVPDVGSPTLKYLQGHLPALRWPHLFCHRLIWRRLICGGGIGNRIFSS